MKLGRTYQMTIQVSPSEAVVAAFPLTLQLDITRNTLASANRGHFRIYNLKPDTRKRIYHDLYNTREYRQIKLQAGYEDESPLPTIFQGNIQYAYSYRQGVDWITEIEAYDGGFAIINAQAPQAPIPSGWTAASVIRSLLQTMAPTVSVGAIGDFDTNNTRGLSLMGNSWNILNRIANGKQSVAFVDNEIANVIGENDYIAESTSIRVISAATGLLDTPRRFDVRLDATILFEPRLLVGQFVQLESLETTYNNSPYKVLGIHHQGQISGAVGGELTTVASLWRGEPALQAVSRAA